MTAWNRQPAANPNGILVSDVNVTKTDATFDITMTPASCGHDFPLLGIKDAGVLAGSTEADSNSVVYNKTISSGVVLYKVERKMAASPPVEGKFTLKWGNKSVKG